MSPYEKTILRLALSFAVNAPFVLIPEDVSRLSNLLMLDNGLLEQALRLSDEDIGIFTGIQLGDSRLYGITASEDYYLFEVVHHYAFITEALEQLSDRTDQNALKHNLALLDGIFHRFSMMNTYAATAECSYRDCFSMEYAPYRNSGCTAGSLLQMLKMFRSCEKFYEERRELLPVLCQILRYHFETQSRVIYLLTAAQIMEHSPYLSMPVRRIAAEFYNQLRFLFQNGRILSVQVNSLPATPGVAPQNRTRRDRTTRLQVLYGYDNYDAYVLRLDLAHQGAGFLHYNNQSPGGVKCCIFTESEHQAAVREFPALAPCFIHYDGRWALKERSNCKLDRKTARAYDHVRSTKEHDPAFQETYTEEHVGAFLEFLGRLLPARCSVPIDTEERHAQTCFRFDKLMCGLECLYLAELSSDQTGLERAIDFIVSGAVGAGLISEPERAEYACLDGATIIAACARERMERSLPL